MLNQLPRNSRHVSGLPSEDVPIFLDEFNGHEFLFGVQTIVHVNKLRSLHHGQWDYLAQ
jgi:hypothetical protein